MKPVKKSKGELVDFKPKKNKERNPFEPGDWVRITNTSNFNKTTLKTFKENPLVQVIESNKWGVRLYGFEGFYHHRRFKPNLALGPATKDKILIDKLGDNIKKLLK